MATLENYVAASEGPQRIEAKNSEVAAAAEIPAQSTLDQQLKAQRLRLLRLYSIGLGCVGGLWSAVYIVYLLAHPDAAPLHWLVASHVAALSASGVIALRFCRRSALRAATYSLVLPLIVMATA